jgi:hypothetical protein
MAMQKAGGRLTTKLTAALALRDADARDDASYQAESNCYDGCLHACFSVLRVKMHKTPLRREENERQYFKRS